MGVSLADANVGAKRFDGSSRSVCMRELVFTVRFAAGASELMDIYRAHPGLSTWSSACFTTEETMWRIDHTEGPAAAIEKFESVFLDTSRCNECLDVPDCDTTREYHVLESTPTSRTVYTHREEVYRCHSLPYVVYDSVGDGVVFQARRTGEEYRWKVLYPGEFPAGRIYDAVENRLREGLSLELLHLRDSGSWHVETHITGELSGEQREALELAVERGYYDRPRAVSVEELADELGVPRSTLQYRLRTAEDLVVDEFVRTTL